MQNKTISILKKYLKIEIKSILLLLGISMISSGVVVAQPYLMQRLIDDAFIAKDLDFFYLFVAIIVVVGILGMILNIFLQYNYTKLSIKVLFALRLDIFEKIFFNNKLFFQKYKTGDLLSRIQGDITELQRFGIDSIFALFSATFGLIGSIIIMAYYDITICLFALILFPIEFYLLKPMYSKMESSTKAVRESTAIIGSFLIESLRYVNFIKKLNHIDDRKIDLTNLQDFNKKRLLEQQKIQIVFAQIPIIIALAARIALILYAGYKVINNELSVGELMAFLTYFSMVLNPVHTILGVINNLPKLKVSINRLEEIVPNIEDKKSIKTISSKPNLAFKNISFSYPNGNTIFENLNLDISYGEKIVLLGSNGAGKSTFFDILSNFLDVNKGKVLIDGVNIKDIENKTLQETIGLVEQNPVILATTLKENILIAKKDASDDELRKALEKVGLTSWLESLENGLDTFMSEGGENLSGGQKQRISIARLILKNPSIILLDEPTSAQDKKFIEDIDKLIDENFKDSTKIIVSHTINYENVRKLTLRNKTIEEEEI